METKEICIIKRDGKRENFSSAKIYNAITKAFVASDLTDCEALIDEITNRVIKHFNTPTIGVEDIQDGKTGSGKEVHNLQTVEKY